MTPAPLLSVEDLTIGFAQDAAVVDGLSFTIKTGETLALVGESGSGKSLSALSILGLLPPTARLRKGQILWSGQEDVINLAQCSESDFRPLRSKEIGMIFQEPLTALNPTKRIGKQLLEAAKLTTSSPKEHQDLVENWLTQVRLTDSKRIMQAYPHELSGGQQQRALIAMAMLTQPKLLIADEPTTALDTVTEAEIVRLLQELTKAHHTALLFISHDLAVVQHLTQSAIIMRNGRVVEKGATADLLSHAEAVYTQELIASSARLNFAQTSREKEVIQTTHQVLDSPALEVEEVSVYYPLNKNWLGRPMAYQKAVEQVSFTLQAGQFVGLIGESGCGKSSLARALVGLEEMQGGAVRFAVENKKNVQLVFQDPYSSLNPVMAIGKMLLEIIRLHQPRLSKAEQLGAVQTLLQQVDLDPAIYQHRLPEELSGGQRQRVAIARALAARPSVLICDEAVSALDAGLQLGIMDLLRNLCREHRISMLFISHDLALVSRYVDQIMVMDKGRIVEEGTPDKLLKNAQHPQTRKLIDAVSFH